MSKRGFVAGAYDPFPHPGHLWSMRQAVESGECDHVLVGLQARGKHGCILSVEERRMMLRALRWVSNVVVYENEDELLNILVNAKPDVRILGEDYRGKRYTGDHLDIPIFWAQRNPEWSTTKFIKRIVELCQPCSCLKDAWRAGSL